MKKFNNLVNSELVRSIKIQDKLSNSVYEYLELDKKQHNIWVIMKQQQVTFVTDHPILATQLQYKQTEIMKHLNQQFLLQLKKSQIKIAPPKAFKKAKKEDRFKISEKSASILHLIADMIEDEEVSNSLKNLTKNSIDTYNSR